MLYNPR